VPLHPDRTRYLEQDLDSHTFETLEGELRTLFVSMVSRETGTTSRPHNRTINAALGEIESRFAENIGLADVADAVGVTPSHLSRLFRHAMDTSFREYLTEVRLDEAKRLLLTTNARVYEISGACGFREQRYFSEVFRKHTGMTPLQFRNGVASTGLSPRV